MFFNDYVKLAFPKKKKKKLINKSISCVFTAIGESSKDHAVQSEWNCWSTTNNCRNGRWTT
jgi:hypothetical protein